MSKYYTALDSMQPGYLARRFRELRKEASKRAPLMKSTTPAAPLPTIDPALTAAAPAVPSPVVAGVVSSNVLHLPRAAAPAVPAQDWAAPLIERMSRVR